MVYCGKPSKGCATCRAKKTKCDRSSPSCSQCIRVGRICPGYRDEQTLMFRDETRKVVRKAKAKELGRNVSPEEDSLIKPSQPYSDKSPKADSRQGDIGVILRNPSPPLEDGAIAFFFHHHVSVGFPISRGFLELLPTIYQKELNSNGSLPEIITAIGLAGISNLRKAPNVMLAARVKHTAALRDVNAALQDPARAKADSTLMTVMLLGLFENITCSSPLSMQAWAKHISGATALTQIRGRNQFQYDLGRRMFTYLRNQILIDCIQRRKAVPQVILDWSQTSYKFQNEYDAVEQQLFHLMAQLCNLRHLIKAQAGETLETTTSAFSIDADLEAWAAALPPIYSYTTVAAHQASSVMFDYGHHIYSNFSIASAWNAYRSARILTVEAIIGWLMRSCRRPKSTPEYERCKLLQNQMADEICASVSYYFERTSNSQDSPYALKAAAGVSLLWPLYVAAVSYHHNDERNVWIIKQFEKIADVWGIRQALALANVLKKNREITIWNREMSNRVDVEDENEDEW